jgi:predicted NUDIX family phosphoesterase
MSDREMVLGLAREHVPGGTGWRGVKAAPLEPYLEAVRSHGDFRPRDEAENDPTWKQVIPYVLLRDGERIFLMRRTKAGGDERLHDRYSIGIGGHVNPADGDIAGGLSREWAEEIDADFQPDFQPIGVLNDDSNAVGAVHLGLVYDADAGGRSVAIREREKLEGSFATLDEVAAVAERLETWSALLFEFLMAHEGESRAGG